MSTLAFDGRYLAADTLLCNGHARLGEVQKLQRLRGARWLYGGAGNSQDVLAVERWIHQYGFTDEQRPKVAENFVALAYNIDKKCLYELEDNLLPQPVTAAEHWAVGAGYQFARAAMACGKNAMEAIEVAIHFDLYTGGHVEYFDTQDLTDQPRRWGMPAQFTAPYRPPKGLSNVYLQREREEMDNKPPSFSRFLEIGSKDGKFVGKLVGVNRIREVDTVRLTDDHLNELEQK